MRLLMPVDTLAELHWPRIGERIARHTGLAFPRERRSDLQRGLAAAAAELGISPAACAERLLSDALTREQLRVLATHLTVGETYFFRDRKAFDALGEHILPRIIRRRRGRRKELRLWSAACSTGEEPYSLAILIRQLLPDWRDWDITVWATDLNERSLQKAAEGVYSDWSFRGAAAGFKEKYFTETAPGRFAIDPETKRLVSFAQVNLAEDLVQALPDEARGMDVIFCRNVLIYFTAAHANQLAANLHRALAPGGWLAVSPSECSQTLFSKFAAVNFPGAILYRKTPPDAPIHGDAWDQPAMPRVACAPVVPSDGATGPSPCAAVSQSTAPAVVPPYAAAVADAPIAATADSSSAPRPAAASGADPGTRPGPSGAEVSELTRALANQGRHADALVSSERWIVAEKTNPTAHYVHAMILQEMGQRRAARDALLRTLYLRPEFALAHFALGNLARFERRTAEAHKHFTNALRLLRDCPPDVILPESDGLSARGLIELITALLEPMQGVRPAGGFAA